MGEKLGVLGVLEIFGRPAQLGSDCGNPDNPKDKWEKILEAHNLFVNTGFNTIADLLVGSRTYSGVTLGYFAWSDGTTAPALTDTATTFYADGSHWQTKAIQSANAYDVTNKTITWNCFLAPTDNTVTSITKFAMMNANPGTVMFNELLFSPIPKDATTERYFRYSITFSQV